MISKDTINFINPNHKYQLSKLLGYSPIAKKILLYDMMLFVNLVSETPFSCSDSDIAAFNKIYDYCIKLNVQPEIYIACAYNYISKYSFKGHKIHLGYFLNAKVVEYCAEHLSFTNEDSLIYKQILSEILILEKSVRTTMTEKKISYDDSFKRLLREKKFTPIYIAYKKHIGYSLLESVPFDGYLAQMLSVLQPIFDFVMSKNGLYTTKKIAYWNNSKIEEFSFCPIMFRDRYLLGEFSEAYLTNEATDDGKKVHQIFEDVINRYIKNKNKDFKKIYDRYIEGTYYESIKEQVPVHLPGVRNFFYNYIDTYINKDSIIYTEKKLEALVEPDIIMGGTLDLLVVNGSKAYILDYKTSKVDPRYFAKNNEKYQKQLSLYSKLLQKTHPEITDIELHVYYTRTSLMVPLEIKNDILDIRIEAIKTIKLKIKLNNFSANRSSCFLCMHPNCESRSKPSMWDTDGKRIIPA